MEIRTQPRKIITQPIEIQQKVLRDGSMEVVNAIGKAFEDQYHPGYQYAPYPNVLKAAQKYAGKEGYIASLPQLIYARIHAPFQPEGGSIPRLYLGSDGPNVANVWSRISAFSEEDVGKSPQGNKVVAVVHGGGYWGDLKRVRFAYKQGLTEHGDIMLTDNEMKDLLDGRLPDGKTMPVYSLDDLSKGNINIYEPHAIVMDWDIARKTKESTTSRFDKIPPYPFGYNSLDEVLENPLFLARVGGPGQAEQYIAKIKQEEWQRPDHFWISHGLDKREAEKQPIASRLGLSNGGGINNLSKNDCVVHLVAIGKTYKQ